MTMLKNFLKALQLFFIIIGLTVGLITFLIFVQTGDNTGTFTEIQKLCVYIFFFDSICLTVVVWLIPRK